MISKNYSITGNVLCKLSVIFVSISVFDNIAGSTFENFDISEYSEELGTHDQGEIKNTYRHQQAYHKSKHYPYEKIRKMIEETKELLSSKEGDRSILKFDAAYNDAYIAGYNERHFYKDDYRNSLLSNSHQRRVMFKSGRRKNATPKICWTEKNTYKPERLKNENGINHLILNLEGEFVQEVPVKKCEKGVPGTKCGSNPTTVELYRDVCEQSYGTFKLFAIPEGDKIDVSNQVLANFKLPNGCNCRSKRG